MHDETRDVFDPYIFRCTHCGRPVDVRSSTVYSKVIGWERKRDAGGTNALALRQPLGEFMHSVCMEEAKNGIAVGQITLDV